MQYLEHLRLEIKNPLHAFAELVDNVSDLSTDTHPLTVDVEVKETPESAYGEFEFRVLDNGPGVEDFDALKRWFGLGFSEKSGDSVGKFGIGAKQACMRLAKSFLVFVKAETKVYIVFFSCDPSVGTESSRQIKAQCMYTEIKRAPAPNGAVIFDPESGDLAEFVKNSNFENTQQLLDTIQTMPNTGTLYIMYNLQNEGEFDVSADRFDVRAMTSAVGTAERTLFTLERTGLTETQKVCSPEISCAHMKA